MYAVEQLQIKDKYKFGDQTYHNIAVLNNTKLHWEILDPLLFANGWSYFHRKIPQSFGITPYYVHANYLLLSAKEYHLKKNNLWFLSN